MSTLRVWKYDVPMGANCPDEFAIEMPIWGQVLTVAMQDGQPRIWALVNPELPVSPRRFRVAGTGHPIKAEDVASIRYVGTFTTHAGQLVWHLFDIGQEVTV